MKWVGKKNEGLLNMYIFFSQTSKFPPGPDLLSGPGGNLDVRHIFFKIFLPTYGRIKKRGHRSSIGARRNFFTDLWSDKKIPPGTDRRSGPGGIFLRNQKERHEKNGFSSDFDGRKNLGFVFSRNRRKRSSAENS